MVRTEDGASSSAVLVGVPGSFPCTVLLSIADGGYAQTLASYHTISRGSGSGKGRRDSEAAGDWSHDRRLVDPAAAHNSGRGSGKPPR